MAWHPRISVNEECAGFATPLAAELPAWNELGVTNIGVISPKLEPIGWNPRVFRDAGLTVSNIGTEERVVFEALEFGAEIGADSVWLTSGSIGSRTWEDAAADFYERIAPAVARANELDIAFALEATSAIRTDISFVFSLRDTLDVAREAGMTVVLELAVSWSERGLERLVRENLDMVTLVQVSDMELGTKVWPNRVVIGDGAIPLERHLAMLLEAGYQGMFDLEQLGPKMEAEGHIAATRRSLERLSEMLDRLGA
jgi:sugar phosphate isomerase/epimerase